MILELTMINWRAYEDHTISFKPGINFIMGPNGKGKTSILEAICYALTGELSTVNDYRRVLRRKDKPATIKLIFKVGGHQYRVERTQLPERVGDANLWEIPNEHRVANSQKRVTEAIEGIIGVSKDFLQRIIYMAEGDVFRFLRYPPGKAMNLQIRQVLGLTQLDIFKSSVQIAQKDLRDQVKVLKTLQQRMEELNIRAGHDLELKLEELTCQREVSLRQVLKLENEMTMLSEETKAYTLLQSGLTSRISLWQSDKEKWAAMQERPLIDFFEDILKNLEYLKENHVEIERNLARLSGQKDSYQQVLGILQKVEKANIVPCPVCKKPMTDQEQHQVENDTQENLKIVLDEISKLQSEISLAKRKIDDTARYLDSVREIRNNLVHNRYMDIKPDVSMAELMNYIQTRNENPYLQELRSQQDHLKTMLDSFEKQRADYVSIQTQLKGQGFNQPDEVLGTLIQLEERLLSLSSASEAIDRTLTDMQNVDLVAIHEQIATIWNNFIRYGKWHLKFDPDGNPILNQDQSRDFDFDQFSGGEKTALLVMIHTIIAHHFSQCSFLMVDEPLEHLDPINRRSLIGFFIAACQNNFFDQALITTYEESLVRKYISNKNVNILYIH